MMYNLSDPVDVQNFKIRCGKLLGRASMIELTEKKPRSLNSNSYLHVILEYFASQTGNTMEDVKQIYYKQVCNSDIFVRRVNDKILGCERTKLRSTSELNQEELSLSIDRFRNWSANVAEIYIPASEEYIELLHAQYEIEKNRRYL